MKRSRSESPRSVRRKSARLAAQPFSRQRVLPSIKPQSNYEDLQLREPRLYCNTCNLYQPLAQGRAGDSGPQNRAHAIAEVVQEIDDLVASTKKRLRRKYAQFQTLTERFVDYVSTRKYIYEDGDLLALPYENLKYTLKEVCYNTSDPERYAAYVMRAITAAAQLPRPRDEKHPKWSPTEPGKEKGNLLDKCLALIGVVIDNDMAKEAVHALVLLKVHLHAGSKRMTYGDHAPAHKALDRIIYALIDDNNVPNGARSCNDVNGKPLTSPHHEHRCTVLMHGLVWHSGPARQGLGEMDFASAARLLRTAYLKHDCGLPHTSCDASRRQCFHQNSLDLPEYLHKRAWSEVRFNVFSTAGTLLSAELAKHVFEYALVAEEVPFVPTNLKSTTQSQPNRVRNEEGVASGRGG
ncbi:uncharacterized protein LTR77_004826 [Saxophila tyrrhenica]|uniref:Uncharacterized protein n=1 Tax=Saxophila tyrrhenica TaxID=1690608 RepID=A0AAV9PDD3_9PEZI|nr:hypothetical protein LTR77_004826 [Saxophila tyrrhenica]